MPKSKKGKGFTATIITYKGSEPDLDKEFYESLGKAINKKWGGSGFGLSDGVRDISFYNLTPSQKRLVRGRAKEIFPSYIGTAYRYYAEG